MKTIVPAGNMQSDESLGWENKHSVDKNTKSFSFFVKNKDFVLRIGTSQLKLAFYYRVKFQAFCLCL